jgi:pyruvate/2-oxoacid:ferredoxin oxidoreductase alpha subunit
MLTVETIGRIRREHFLIREIARDLKVSRNTVRKVLWSGETSFDYERSVQPHTFFQAREASNPYYTRVPAIVQSAMNRFAALTGRAYTLFEYDGPPDAERVIVLMGSGAETARETAAFLRKPGEPVGVLQIRLYRHFLAALPESCRAVAVLEQAKEVGAAGRTALSRRGDDAGSGG